MKRFILFLTLFLITQTANADLLNNTYISPERYAVNEADMQIDYSKIPPAPKFDLDGDMRFNAPNLVEKDINIGEQNKEEPAVGIQDEAYKKKLSYKFAKWWVDKRYEREEAHHGSLHEIKVQKRLEHETK